MSIVIFGDSFYLSNEDAASNRVLTYAKGFYENGVNVHIICFANEYTFNNNGAINNGITYYHPFGQRTRSKYFIVRRWYKFAKYLRTIALVKKINKDDKIIAFICYTEVTLTQLFAYRLAKYVKTYLMLERGEHPLRNYHNSFLRKFLGDIKLHLEIKFCYNIICISQYLINFYKSRGVSPARMLMVTSTVDTERFKTPSESPLSFQYILYCGRLTILKDGVNILIESFVKISEKYPEINLVLIGKGDSDNEVIMLKELVEKLNINRRVFFLGQMSRTEIPAYLNNAKILALARPRSIIADAGFPSKLTEYLATGNPVVVTEVGDIPVFLKDNENAFLSKPDSIEAFAEKLAFVLDNYKFAKEVARKGRDLTDTIFNYNYQSKRILDYIKSF
jgi:glycosyltransferase involved in cell wall biosynthesis